MQKTNLKTFHTSLFRLSCQTVPRSLFLAALVFWVVLPVNAPVNAAVIDDLYSVTVPVVNQKLKNRRAAFNTGLKQVLIRVTGSRSNLSSIKLPNASSYVKKFQYLELSVKQKEIAEQLEKQLKATGKLDLKRIPTQSLWVQYNETKINDFIKKNALPSWNEHRVDSVIWVAVNDGVNRYVLRGIDQSLLKTVTDESASRRAIPIVWPDVEAEDQAIRFADVWAGFEGPLKDISSQFAEGPIVVGKLLWNGGKWNSEWLLLLDGKQTEWAIDHSDYNVLIKMAVDNIADTLGQQYARFETEDTNALHVLPIEVQNVNSISSLGRIKKYLLSIPQVEKAALKRIQRDSVFYNISLKANTEEFLAFIKTGDTISVVPADPTREGNKSQEQPQIQVEPTQDEVAQIKPSDVAVRFRLQ